MSWFWSVMCGSGLADEKAPEKITDMVTGEEHDPNEAIAAHIYQQRWPTDLLVSS